MMSASPSIDPYDAQMLDFSSDPDVPMHLTSSAEFFAEALMDHDTHLAASTFSEHPSIEVEMEEYVGDNAEYEMADETAAEYQRHGDELLDVEVYDASRVASPLIPPQPLQQPVDVPIDSEHPVTTYSEHELQGEPQSEVHAAPLDHAAADDSHVEPSASGEVVVLEVVASEPMHPTDAPDEGVPPASESHEQLAGFASTIGQLVELPTPVEAADEKKTHSPVTEHTETVRQEGSEPLTAGSTPLARDEKTVDQVLAAEVESANPLHISDDVYIDPPPAVLLSVGNVSEPAGFALFNQPEVEDEATKASPGKQKVYSLLLESRPTLYYEPLSNVFEALRQDEDLLSLVLHSFEGELVLDAYDLQLSVSEDNVHSREISLHDLNILHDGSDFAGPLRLSLRANVPRFIIRYYALQEQIQRLHIAAEAVEGQRDEEHREHYGAVEERPRQEAVSHHSPVAAAVSEGLQGPSPTEAEESFEEPAGVAELTDETPQLEESGEPDGTSAGQEPPAEYHEATEEATHTLEDENDYEGNNVSNEDESSKSDNPDADQAHETVVDDTDAPATVAEQESEFGGEQTEYLDYAQPEEYDERYGEDLSERAGGTTPVQYEPQHYEGGEQDTSTAVDETQVALPGSDEEDQSTATPIPPRAEPSDTNPNDEPVSLQHQISTSSREELATSGSTNEVKHAIQASGNREPTVVREKIFSEIDESDSNFVLMLEKEADAEFVRTFNAEQNEQEISLEATLQHESWHEDEWDDEDAEGDDEADWIDPDADSNESSVTLSSKASSKRSFDEVDPGEEPYVENLESSPGSKRPRVQ